jgi:uncharacterized glyoxalase superfamily protein PhnB
MKDMTTYLNFDGNTRSDAFYARCLGADLWLMPFSEAKIEVPPDTFWGARFGMIMDQFGVSWMFDFEKSRT